MLALIFLLVFGSGLTYLALQDTTRVTFTLFGSTFTSIPLFTVIIISMLVGAFMAYIIYLVRSISTAFKIHGKDKKIKDSEKSVTELTKKIHQLELENESLRNTNPTVPKDDKSL